MTRILVNPRALDSGLRPRCYFLRLRLAYTIGAPVVGPDRENQVNFSKVTRGSATSEDGLDLDLSFLMRTAAAPSP
jgi:hypothetical protein